MQSHVEEMLAFQPLCCCFEVCLSLLCTCCLPHTCLKQRSADLHLRCGAWHDESLMGSGCWDTQCYPTCGKCLARWDPISLSFGKKHSFCCRKLWQVTLPGRKQSWLARSKSCFLRSDENVPFSVMIPSNSSASHLTRLIQSSLSSGTEL